LQLKKSKPCLSLTYLYKHYRNNYKQERKLSHKLLKKDAIQNYWAKLKKIVINKWSLLLSGKSLKAQWFGLVKQTKFYLV
jgi:hypothetical protein